jgi:hypothetical protein
LEVDSADTSQLPKEKTLLGQFQYRYVQITQPSRSTVPDPAVDHPGFKYGSATVKYFLLTGKPGRFYFWYRRLQILDVLQPGGLVLNK